MRSDDLPERMGPYRILSRLGAGGMGQVYLALDPDGRTVAIKQLHPALTHAPGMRERLRREVAAMHEVRSPRVAEILAADVDAETPFIVTRYVQGRTLEDVVAAQGPLARADLLRVAGGLAEALAAIHRAGHVHRDLKPANVMLADGDPVVIDFGIAQAQDATRITQAGGFTGTPGHLAPEVLDGSPSGPAVDVFSWATTVGYAATGRRVFGDGPPQAVLYRSVHGQADLEGVPDDLRPLLASALARDPGARPAPEGIIDAIARLPGGAAGPTIATAPSRPRPRPAGSVPSESRPPESPKPADPRPEAGTGRRKVVLASAGATAVVLTAIVTSVLIADGEGDTGGRGASAGTRSPTPTPTARQVPVYQDTIGSFAPALRFREFLYGHVKQEIRITAEVSGEIAPRTSAGRYDTTGGNTDPYLFLWGRCFEPLQQGESPTLEKCDAIQVTITGKERPGRPGLEWAHSRYTLIGNFRVDGGAVHQGVAGFALIPVE